MKVSEIHALSFESEQLPPYPTFIEGIRRAPRRDAPLSPAQERLALKNALRYLPERWHEAMAPEFLRELRERGRIYGYRFRPQGRISAKPIEDYASRCVEGKALRLMIDNNLDFDVALYPYELVTYGETGQVCQNWMQYRLICRYLELLDQDKTLVVESGHPLGLFASHPLAPRAIVTNGLMIGMFDNQRDFNIAAALGVANYGQMTAGGWMYIGPQGIVHGTYNTLLNAGRLKLGLPPEVDLAGKIFVSSGLGGMSGAQGKAAVIAGAASIIAEVDDSRIETRLSQGWVSCATSSIEEAFTLAGRAAAERKPIAVAFHGNIVDLLEAAAGKTAGPGQTAGAGEVSAGTATAGQGLFHIDLLSDQTSCHAAYEGGYCPVGIDFKERTRLLAEDRAGFKGLVDESLGRHFRAIQKLVNQGSYFFDYGNSFLKAVFDAGIREVSRNGVDEKDGFIFPSYVEDILGPELFDYGYGPFRWVCLSGKPEDLRKTDAAAMSCIDPKRRGQDRDNWIWIRDAEKNALVVGSQARILYQDALGRRDIALTFNRMVREKEIGPVMLGRDHHDTGGTDSPFRETSNIKDGSNIMADMATQCFAGNAARGMSLVALHNGGGVGIGKAVNGGFGLVLDGSERVDMVIRTAMPWDVMGGVARRAWARNTHARETCLDYNENHGDLGLITIPEEADESLLDRLFESE
ncbi:MAG: urocanate hydratase [Spirochaetales bacterium]|nr:urocanate hydratase [Spirochaetales bacterium]